MYKIFLWLLIIIFLLILFKLLKIKNNYIICLIISIFIILFIVNIKISLRASIAGAILWFKAILPTSFPFAVACNLLISYDGISLYSKVLGPLVCKPLNLSENSSFPLAVSFLCGYPLGSKFTSDTYELGYIERDEFLRLLSIATNCGPLFIIGTVGCSMLNNIEFGYLLLIANYLSIILIGLFTKKKIRSPHYSKKVDLINNKNINFGSALKKALEDGINTVLAIGGFIILFSVLITIIKNSSSITLLFHKIEQTLNLKSNSLYSLFLGSIEITNGCNLIATSNLSIPIKLSCISFLCSFSGLSIIAQCYSFFAKHNISLLRYFLLKLLQGVLSFFITFICSNLFLGSTFTSTIPSSYSLSYIAYFIPLIILLLITLIGKIINKLLHSL